MKLNEMELFFMKRYENYVSGLAALRRAPEQDLSNDYVQSGLINKFSIQFDLGWKLLKALLAYEGDPIAASGSPREIIKASYKYFDFVDEDAWLQMLRDRNTMTHLYDGNEALRLVDVIIDAYLPQFEALKRGLDGRYGELLTKPDDAI